MYGDFFVKCYSNNVETKIELVRLLEDYFDVYFWRGVARHGNIKSENFLEFQIVLIIF